MLTEYDFTNQQDFCNYLYKMRLELETLSSTHIRWYTHKNPAGCWICDLFKLLNLWEDIYYPKSPKNDMNKVSVLTEINDVVTSDSGSEQSG